MRNSILNFIFPLEEDCNLALEENLETNSAGLKSWRTRGVWRKSLEESHSAQIKEKSLLGHLACSEETQRNILESDIFCIIGSEGVTLCSVQSFSFKVCFDLWIKNGEGETSRYRDPMPFWRFRNLS